jgi:hypothetical protein
MASSFAISVGAQVLNRLIPWYGDIQAEPSDEAPFTSMLGTPVFAPLEFLKVSGTSLDNTQDVGGQNGNSQTFLRIDTCLITVNQTRNIIKTPIQGRNGTIKEYISDGDFELNIKGVIISPYMLQYPADEVSIFIELMGLQKQIPVASEFLQRFGIDAIVIDSYNIGERLGSRNEVPFEINASSDFAEEIVLTRKDEL